MDGSVHETQSKCVGIGRQACLRCMCSQGVKVRVLSFVFRVLFALPSPACHALTGGGLNRVISVERGVYNLALPQAIPTDPFLKGSI